MAELIQRDDSLNKGRVKLNEGIMASERAEGKSDQAVSTAQQAVNTAGTAETKADSVQEQFNQVVIEGDSSVEAAQARVKEDGTSFTTLQERLNSSDTDLAQTAKVVNIKKYDAIGDGINDDTLKIKQAIHEMDSGVLHFPKGIYKITQPIIIEKSDILLDFDKGAKVIFAPTTGNTCFHFRGTRTKVSELSQSSNEGTNVIQVNDVNDFSVGEWIYIESTSELVSTTSREYDTKREFQKITGIDSETNEITLASSLVFSYAHVKTVEVYKTSLLHNVSVNNLIIEGIGNNLHQGVKFEWCFKPEISHSKVYDTGSIGIEIRHCVFGSVIDNYVQINYADSLQYGIVVHSSMHTVVSNNQIHSARTAIDVTRVSSFVTVSDNTSYVGGINTHVAKHVIISSNTIHGGGIMLRAHYVIVDGNQVYGNVGSDYYVLESHESTSLGNLIISNNIFRGSMGFRFYGGKSVKLVNNTFEATDYITYGNISSLFRFLFDDKGENVSILDNTIKYVGSKPQPTHIFHTNTVSNLKNLIFDGNTIEGGEIGIDVRGENTSIPTDRVNLKVTNNTIKSSVNGVLFGRWDNATITGNNIEADIGIMSTIYEDNIGLIIKDNIIKNATTPIRFIRFETGIIISNVIYKNNIYINCVNIPVHSSFESKSSIIENNILNGEIINKIIDGGSISGWSYVQMNDGTKIYTKKASLGSRVAMGDGTYQNPYRTVATNIDFPITFNTTPDVSFIIDGKDMNSSSRLMSATCAELRNNQINGLQAVALSSNALNENVSVSITVIGR